MSWRMRFGFFVLGTLVALAAFAPLLPIADPRVQNLALDFCSPRWEHWLGCAENGVDLFSQLLWALRHSMVVAVSAVALSIVVALVVGVTVGLRGSWVDVVFLRVVDFLMAFPGLLLVVALAAFFEPGRLHLIFILSFGLWCSIARQVRVQVMSLKTREFFEAARALGQGRIGLVRHHLLPNLAPLLVVRAAYSMGHMIVVESSLSFLGLGVDPSEVTLGHLLAQGREVVATSPHVGLATGSLIVSVVLLCQVLGDELKGWLDPKFQP